MTQPRTMFYLKCFIGLFVIGLVTLFFYFDLHHFLTLHALKNSHMMLSALYDASPLIFTVSLICLIVLFSTLSVPTLGLAALLAGSLYGTLAATVMVIMAMSIGGLANFLVARFIFKDWLQDHFTHRIKRIDDHIQDHGFHYMLFIRLSGIFPFSIINILLGVTSLRWPAFFWGTIVGISPIVWLFSFLGNQLLSLNSLKDLLSPMWILLFLCISALSLIPIFLKRKTRSNALD